MTPSSESNRAIQVPADGDAALNVPRSVGRSGVWSLAPKEANGTPPPMEDTVSSFLSAFRDAARKPAAPVGGRYELTGDFTHEGAAVALRGRDLDLDRDIVLKVPLGDPNTGSEITARFVAEARLAGSLQHSGIPAVYELGTLPDRRPFVTRKLVQGRTLAALLRERHDPRHDLQRFLKMFEQICQTIAYAHSRGIAHRNLKPETIVVGEFGEMQVIGWAATTDSAGQRDDLFALGMVLGEILTGVAVAADILARLDNAPADPEVIRIAKACLASDPARRPQDASAIAARVNSSLEDSDEKWLLAESARSAVSAQLKKEQVLRQRSDKRFAWWVVIAAILGAVGALLSQRRAMQRRDDEIARVEARLAEVRGEMQQSLAPPSSEQPLLSHVRLGQILLDTNETKAAIAEFRAALANTPDNAEALIGLGTALRMSGDLAGAKAALVMAAAAAPRDARPRVQLGLVRRQQGEGAESIQEFRKAIEIDPNNADAHRQLALELFEKQNLPSAIAELREAVALSPTEADSHAQLGDWLAAAGSLDDAGAEYRRAVERNPSRAAYRTKLGRSLEALGDRVGALAEYRAAAEIAPDNAEIWPALGAVLRQQGKFLESLQAYRHGHKLAANPKSAEDVFEAERWLAADAKLQAILRGEATPSGAAEQMMLAAVCYPFRNSPAAAVRFYTAAFADASPPAGRRIDAAGAAVLAADGQGHDALLVSAAERARYRQQALAWLRDELAVARPAELRHMREAPDLAPVRGEALAKLPPWDRAEWEKLWIALAAALKRAG